MTQSLEQFGKLYHYTKLSSAEKIISSQTLRASSPLRVNDEFEFTPHYILKDGRIGRAKKWKALAASYFGFICFCKESNSPAMWSRYAQKYRGVVFEFNFATSPFKEHSQIAWLRSRPVEYEKERAVFDEKKYLDLVNANQKDASHEMVMNVLIRKEESWTHEKEVRLFLLRGSENFEGDVVSRKEGDVFFKFYNSVSVIYCGHKMTKANFRKLEASVKNTWPENPPPVVRVTPSETAFGFKEFEVKKTENLYLTMP